MCEINRSFREVKEEKQIFRKKAPVYYSTSTRNWKHRKEEIEQEIIEQEIEEQYDALEKVLPF